MTTRRTFLAGALLALGLTQRAGAQPNPQELTPAPLPDQASATPIPVDEFRMYQGDVEDLWREPWEIGTSLIEVGVVIEERFEGTETMGYAIGNDGLVVQSVIYGEGENYAPIFLASNSGLSELEGVKALKVIGTYEGTQQSNASADQWPVVLVHETIIAE